MNLELLFSLAFDFILCFIIAFSIIVMIIICGYLIFDFCEPFFLLRKQRKNAIAEERAKQLFLRHLTPLQLYEYKTYKRICVIGSQSGDKYTIFTRNKVMNVYGPNERNYCAYCPDVPLYDSLLAQKLMIELDEPEFIRAAVISF